MQKLTWSRLAAITKKHTANDVTDMWLSDVAVHDARKGDCKSLFSKQHCNDVDVVCHSC